jgi:hypothetical protein
MENSIQDKSINESFNVNTSKQLKTIKFYIEKIKNEYINLIEQINKYTSQKFLKKFDNTLSCIDDYISWLINLNQSNKDNIIKENKEHFNDFEKQYNDLDINISFLLSSLQTMKNFSEESNNIMNMIHEYSLPSTNNNSDNNNADKTGINLEQTLDSTYYRFYGDEADIEIKTDNNENNSLICDGCTQNKGTYHCNHCNSNYCNSCAEAISKIFTPHELKKIDEKSLENENQKTEFINSFINFFKDYILKCDYILKKGDISFVDQNTRKVFQFPLIQNEEDRNEFLEQINKSYELIKEHNINSINSGEISNILKKTFEQNIFPILKIEANYFNDFDYNFIQDEKLVIDENNKKNDKKEKEKINKMIINNNIANKFFYVIHIINKEKNNYDDNIKKEILDNISQVLSIDKDNISIVNDNKRIFMDNFIKTEMFSKLPLSKIRLNFPNIPKLYEFKLIIDGLIRSKCKIPIEKLNFKYNFEIPNTSLSKKRGNEIYNPSYGWIGIGLNINNNIIKNLDWITSKDNTSKWAIAYYGFGKKLTSNEIIKKLYDIIINNNLNKDDSLQLKSKYKDIRHNKKIGVGIYMSPFVDVSEQFSGIIYFNNKRYKIVLMARVLIENIKEPEDNSYWILNNKDIRFYRILLKEIV